MGRDGNCEGVEDSNETRVCVEALQASPIRSYILADRGELFMKYFSNVLLLNNGREVPIYKSHLEINLLSPYVRKFLE